MDYARLLVERINQLCKARRISINCLAGMSGVKQSTLENIMLGITKNPGIQTLHKVALAFNMTIAEFLDFEALNAYSFADEEPDED